MNSPDPGRWAPELRSVLRIVAAFLFIAHGAQKLFVWPVLQPRDPAALGSLTGIAGIIELVGGALMLVGLFSRPVAFILAGQMAVAYFKAHAPQNFWPILNRGELAVLYCFVWLYFSAAGPGPWSIDAMIRRPKKLKIPVPAR